MKKKVESFELKVPETITVPKESLIKVIAKSLSPTIHPEDKDGMTERVFEESELQLAARSLAMKPITLNHKKEIQDAIVVNANYNIKDKVVEAILSLPKSFIDLVNKKEITKVSVEYIWDSVKKEGKKSIFKGLKFIGLSLLQGIAPGDPNAKILFEGKSGRETMEIVKGEPFADYTDMDDCISKNQDKEDPSAYCASIMHKTEQVPTTEEECVAKGGTWDNETQVCTLPVEEQELPDNKEDCETKGGVWDEETSTCTLPTIEPVVEQDVTPISKEQCEEQGGTWNEETKTCTLPEEPTVEKLQKRVKELEEALERNIKTNKESKENIDKMIKSAKKESINSLIEELESKMPPGWVYSKWHRYSARRFREQIHKIIYNKKKELEE